MFFLSYPRPVMVKCVAVIKEFYRKADKVQVKVLGRKKLSKKSKSKVKLEKEVDLLYDDWTTEDWQEDGFLGSSRACKIFSPITHILLLSLFLIISMHRN